MAYDEDLELQILSIVDDWPGTAAKKMFGGVCHLLHGNMFCGVWREYVILRLGEEGAQEALGKPGTKPFDVTGRPMKGWVMVEKGQLAAAAQLRVWLERARGFASTLPPK
ncbi:MAG TPA: TfoX/Sxy family protein [Deferrisomatales bacterium]|nr:TfoX/Sxy family protein [Deferrisomatales bacterium]